MFGRIYQWIHLSPEFSISLIDLEVLDYLFLLNEFWLSFKGSIHFVYFAKFNGLRLFKIFACYPISIYTICGDVTSFIPNSDNLYTFCLCLFLSLTSVSTTLLIIRITKL